MLLLNALYQAAVLQYGLTVKANKQFWAYHAPRLFFLNSLKQWPFSFIKYGQLYYWKEIQESLYILHEQQDTKRNQRTEGIIFTKLCYRTGRGCTECSTVFSMVSFLCKVMDWSCWHCIVYQVCNDGYLACPCLWDFCNLLQVGNFL